MGDHNHFMNYCPVLFCFKIPLQFWKMCGEEGEDREFPYAEPKI